MSFEPNQFRALIEEVLQAMHPTVGYSDTARELLMLTAAQESHLGKYIKQINGPARGVFQMEPATERDIWQNYLRYRHELRRIVEGFMNAPGNAPADGAPEIEKQGNLLYQIAMARIHYLRTPKALPSSADSLESLATYWKEFYNTPLGAGTVEEAVKNYERFCR